MLLTEAESKKRRVKEVVEQLSGSEKELWLLRCKNADVWKRKGDQKCQKEVGGEKAREGQKGIVFLFPL